MIKVEDMKTKDFESLFYVSRRNKKLIPNAHTKFMIWSIPAIKTCPGACAACKKCCYARTSEKAYPDVLPSREKRIWSLRGR